jgi:hypothetical protein
LSYYTASTILGNKSHTTMYHDTIIVLELSFRYRKSIYYSLVTLSKSSYLYIDFAICKWSWKCIACSFYLLLFDAEQHAYKLTFININRISSNLLFFIAFVMRVDLTLICLYISSFYFKQNFVVYEINFELFIGISVFSNISSSWS